MSLLDLATNASLQAQPDFGPPPGTVVLAAGGRVLALAEPDGMQTETTASTLRLACRCAWCTRARIDGTFPQRFESLAITHAELIGGYALRLHFSDGHDRGIFPWSFIRTIAAEAAHQSLEPSHA